MRVRFWGVRGSIPWAAADAIGHGCNTPCVEVLDEYSGRTLILDAGTGIIGFGSALAAGPQRVSILLSHYHWDHVQGLLLLPPMYRPACRIDVVGPRLPGVDAEWAEPMFRPPFFPLRLDGMPSPPRFSIVDPGELEVGGFSIRMHPLRHPGGCYAYRIAGTGGDLVYATDHELGDPAADGALAAFAFNAGAVILDTHFTPEELAQHQAFGHGTWRHGAELASAASAGHLWLFHHKPGRTDAELEAIEDRARHVFPATSAAREGLTFTL